MVRIGGHTTVYGVREALESIGTHMVAGSTRDDF